MAQAKSVIGAPVPRIEGAEKVSGRALYAADIRLPGMLWGKVLRSPLPHARIVRIDAAKARQVAGVKAVVTGKDIPGHLTGRSIRDIPVLCWDKVRFVGDHVAGVAAETPAAVDEALARIEVEYEELPAVFDPLEAMRPDAPRLHNDVAAYENAPKDLLIPDVPNGLTRMTWKKGDIEQGFREADLVLEHTFRTPMRHQGYIEPHAGVVMVHDDGRLDVWASNKTPLGTRNQLAHALKVPPERIRINIVNVGGDFGGKSGAMELPIAYYLAKEARRPVKMIMSYSEELTASNPCHLSVITIRTGVKRDGRIVARYLRALHGCGAYGGQKPVRASISGAGTAGPYRIDHTSIEAIQVYTNTVPCGFWRAPGALQTIFAVESHMDMCARELKMDPAEFRLRNIIGEGEENALGLKLRGVKARETLQAALTAAGWKRPKPGPNYGRGIAMYERFTGAGPSWVTVTAEPDGNFTALTVSGDQGTGLRTILCQAVAQEMAVPIERVRVVVGDTDAAPFSIDIGFGGSRSTNIGAKAVIQACNDLKQKLAALAGPALGCEPDQVLYGKGHFWDAKNQRRKLAVREIMRRAGGPVTVTARIDVPIEKEATSFVAQIAQVEVDPETGRVRVDRFVTAHDAGTIINPIGHQGQIDGGSIMGLGAALTEEMPLKEGRITTANLGEYKLLNIADVPKLKTVLVHSKNGPGPYDMKAIGEMANVSPPGAIANAVADAIGVRLFELPITAERIWDAMRERR
jgi:CO/xanthine dehydrogenase Mo-binding subunit